VSAFFCALFFPALPWPSETRFLRYDSPKTGQIRTIWQPPESQPSPNQLLTRLGDPLVRVSSIHTVQHGFPVFAPLVKNEYKMSTFRIQKGWGGVLFSPSWGHAHLPCTPQFSPFPPVNGLGRKSANSPIFNPSGHAVPSTYNNQKLAYADFRPPSLFSRLLFDPPLCTTNRGHETGVAASNHASYAYVLVLWRSQGYSLHCRDEGSLSPQPFPFSPCP
jgi:hypothetical protein